MIHLVLFVLGLVFGGALLPAAQAIAAGPGEALFTNRASVHRFEVELSEENMASLRVSPRKYVPATVRALGQRYTNVGVHLKGVATFRPVDDQPSLTLKFDKFDKAQRFHGLRKIHLNNGKEDPTFLCEAISAEMFAQAGLPVARVAMAQTRLNGRNLGPYVAIEGFTEEFLARYFQNTRGNLYDSGFRHDITYPLEKLLGKKPHDRADLKKLAAAAAVPDLERRWEALGAALDTNSFARYLAMQVLTWNWDGYALFQNNYRVYHDPESQRLFFFPHGMDQMFSRPNGPAMPRWNGLVARAFMETPQGRELYKQQLGTLFTRVYRSAEIAGRVDELAALVRPLIAEQDERAAMDYDRRVSELRGRILLRGEFLKYQLATTNWANIPARR
jgi:spore coat protein CotH